MSTDLHNNYAASGFTSGNTHALQFGSKPALLVIDVCNAYLTPGSPMYAPNRFQVALESTERLITKCRETGIPVLFSRVVYPTPESGGNWYLQKIPKALSCFDAGNKLGDYPDGSEVCRPNKGEVVIEKQFSSAFFGTALASVLFGMKVDTLCVCGYSTSGCVRATTVDAMQVCVVLCSLSGGILTDLSFSMGSAPMLLRMLVVCRCLVSSDVSVTKVCRATGDRHESPHEANLFDIQAKFGEVVSEEEFMVIVSGFSK